MADTMEKKIQDFKTAMAAMLANAPLIDNILLGPLKVQKRDRAEAEKH